MSHVFVRVALDHPLPTLFDYRCDAAEPPRPGTLVSVPFGKRQVVGLVCEVTAHSDVPADTPARGRTQSAMHVRRCRPNGWR